MRHTLIEISQTTVDLLHKYELIHNLLWAC